MTPIRWGILGVSKFAQRQMIPSVRKSSEVEIVAIASRDLDKAQAAAREFGIPKAYGSYEALLADPDVEVIYNPLPNHLHVPWSIKAAEAGKHVLCEKPIALGAAQAALLLAARDRTGVVIQEAVMVRTQPRWLAARELIRNGRIGTLRAVQGFFSYFNDAADNVRNQADIGGGGLMDIGFYPITLTRFCFGAEPTRVLGLLERDPRFGTDRLTSAILEFPEGQATFTCSTQLAPYQEMHLLGTDGRIFVDWPFNTPADVPSQLVLHTGRTAPIESEVLTTPASDQYTVQAELFGRAVRGEADPAVPLEDAIATMAVIDALFRSARSGTWEAPQVPADRS